jgi:hypothetical protein
VVGHKYRIQPLLGFRNNQDAEEGEACPESGHRTFVRNTQAVDMRPFAGTAAIRTAPSVRDSNVHSGTYLTNLICHPFHLVGLDHFVRFFFMQRY